MKLEYSRPTNGEGNFGDDLNAWFWDHFAPGLTDDDGSAILLGIGTILSGWFTDDLPRQSWKVVLGSGGGKAGGAPDFDGRWRIYGVRGPLTAAYSGLGPELVLTDPAVLLRDLDEVKDVGPREGVGFMPHIWSTQLWDWRRTCQELGFIYVDPRTDSRATIRQIAGLKRLITEAMHGAIVADALRTPWLAVAISRQFEASKWCDWGGSLGLAVTFQILPELYHGRRSTRARTLMARAKESAARAGVRFQNPSRPPSSTWEMQSAKTILQDLAADGQSFRLSRQDKLEAAVRRTYQAIDQLKRDKDSGLFENS